MSKTSEVDKYIDGFSKEQQKNLKQMKSIIQSCMPDSTEKISYGMPAFKSGKTMIYFGGFANHIGLYPMHNLGTLEHLVTKYRNPKRKATLQFSYDEPLPTSLIEKLINYKLKENSTRK